MARVGRPCAAHPGCPDPAVGTVTAGSRVVFGCGRALDDFGARGFETTDWPAARAEADAQARTRNGTRLVPGECSR